MKYRSDLCFQTLSNSEAKRSSDPKVVPVLKRIAAQIKYKEYAKVNKGIMFYDRRDRIFVLK